MDDSHPTDELDGLREFLNRLESKEFAIRRGPLDVTQKQIDILNARLPIWRVSLPGPNQAEMLSTACCNPTKFLGIGRPGRLVSVGRARRLRPTNVPVIVEEPARYRPSN